MENLPNLATDILYFREHFFFVISLFSSFVERKEEFVALHFPSAHGLPSDQSAGLVCVCPLPPLPLLRRWPSIIYIINPSAQHPWYKTRTLFIRPVRPGPP
jgi:hypothetical protein